MIDKGSMVGPVLEIKKVLLLVGEEKKTRYIETMRKLGQHSFFGIINILLYFNEKHLQVLAIGSWSFSVHLPLLSYTLLFIDANWTTVISFCVASSTQLAESLWYVSTHNSL